MAHKVRGMKYNVVEEYVPCVHAKPKNGKPGLHKVKVVFDTDWSIKTATCTCLDEHGVDAILALHQAGLNVCYSQIVKILDLAFAPDRDKKYQKYLDSIKYSPDTKYANSNLVAATSIKKALDSANKLQAMRKGFVEETNRIMARQDPIGSALNDDTLARIFSGVSGLPADVKSGYLSIYGRSVAYYENGAWTLDGDLDQNVRRITPNLVCVSNFSRSEDKFCFVCCKSFAKKFDKRHQDSDQHREMVKLRILSGLKASTAKGRKMLKAKGPLAFYDKSILKNMKDNAAWYDLATEYTLDTYSFASYYRSYLVARDVKGAIKAMRRTTKYAPVPYIPDFKLTEYINKNYMSKEKLSNVWNFQDQA